MLNGRPYDERVKVVDGDMEEVDEAEVVTVFDEEFGVKGGVDEGLINDVENGVEEDISEGDEELMDVVDDTVGEVEVELRVFEEGLVKVVDKKVEEAGAVVDAVTDVLVGADTLVVDALVTAAPKELAGNQLNWIYNCITYST